MNDSRPRREGFLRVRMGSDESARWTAAAQSVGHPSLSSWIRALADEAAATGNNGCAVTAALVGLRQDLAQGIGNNLNQLAKVANQRQGIDSQAIALASRDVEAARRAVTKAVAVIRPPRVRAAPAS